MFSYAVITDEVSQDLEDVIRFCGDFALDGIEIRSVWNKPPHQLTEGDIARLRDGVGEAGLKVFGIAAPFFKCDIRSDADFDEHLDILRRCINLAQALDTNLIRVFAFWRQDPFEDYLDQIVERYQEPIRIAEAEGIILGVENEHSTMVGTGRDTRTLVNRLDSPAVKVIWDPCNEFHDSRGDVPFPAGYNHVKDVLAHVHIKDAVLQPDEGAICVPMGDGEIDFKGQFQALAADGYSGCISLETHWRPKPEQIERQLLDRPGGQAFSELGEEASRICFENTFKLLNEIGISR
ncbi:MAG: sugar phosphate isomerase/epimerase [Candidatus Latescibacteria bacterium]|nr:sugar phosphate isomerase/epimerase [Candidatus Latescibacterota bacterium]